MSVLFRAYTTEKIRAAWKGQKMNQMFHTENQFFVGISKLADSVWLSLLWLLCSVPVVTIGAATTALYYAVNKCIKNDRGYVTSEFFRSFRLNFKQSTIIWLIFAAIYGLLGFDYIVMKTYADAGVALGQLYVAFFVFGAAVTMWGVYVFPYIARFEDTTKNVFKHTMILAVRNIQWTIVLGILFFGMLKAVSSCIPIVIGMPVLYQLLKNIILERLFQKYMKPEDLELEKERNQHF